MADLEARLHRAGRGSDRLGIGIFVIAVVRPSGHCQIGLAGDREQLGIGRFGGVLIRAVYRRASVDATPRRVIAVLGKVGIIHLVLRFEARGHVHDDIVVVAIVEVAVCGRAAACIPSMVRTILLVLLGVEQLAVFVVDVRRVGGVAIQINEDIAARQILGHLLKLNDYLRHIAVEPHALENDNVAVFIGCRKQGVQVVAALGVGAKHYRLKPARRARVGIGARVLVDVRQVVVHERRRIVFNGNALNLGYVLLNEPA